MRDPIYSYIPYTKPSEEGETTEECLINNPWVQRLRRLRQNQWAYMVYPSLQHTRFEHSLGVMHLSGLFAKTWYAQYHAAKIIEGVDQHPSVAYVEELARLAGLLHDIGHGPFSHKFEEAAKELFGDNCPSHELLSCSIIKDSFSSQIEKINRSPSCNLAADEKLHWEQVAYLINHDYKPTNLTQGQKLIVEQLQPILSGFFDVDRLDYLARDSHHGGTKEYGTIDTERLLTTIYFDRDGNIAIPQKSMPCVRNMLLARLQMFETIYYHPRVRAFELDAGQLLIQILKTTKIPNPQNITAFLEKFFELDDHAIFGHARELAKSNDKNKQNLGKSWASLFDRHKKWQCIDSLQQTFEPKYMQTIQRSISAWTDMLIEQLEEWRTKGKSDVGTNWPKEITATIDLTKLVQLDAPAYSAKLRDFLKEDTVYKIVDEKGNPIKDSTPAKLLRDIAGINFVLVRVYSVEKLASLATEAWTLVKQKEELLKPS